MSRFRMIRVILAAVLTLAFMMLPRSTRALDGKTVTYDTPVESQITDQVPEEDWTLNASGKDRLQITVDRTGGTLVPMVELRDANNQRTGGANPDDSYARAQTSPFDLPAAGTYTVAVSRYNGKDGKTSGNYKLTVKLVSSGTDSQKPTAAPVDYDKPVSGEITNAAWQNLWQFTATAKDYVTIVAQRTDGSLYPLIDLLDGSGNKIMGSSIADSYDKATISHAELPGPGKYQVRVYRYSDFGGVTTGKYSLTVSLDGSGPENPNLVKPVGTAAFDSSYNGTLTNAKWLDVYTFQSQSKDHVVFKATRTDGNLFPTLYLLGANKQEIQRSNVDDTGLTSVLDVTLPGPGQYEIHVQRYYDAAGTTSGKYELDVVLLGIGEDNPSLKTSAGEVKIGTAAKGTLTNAKWQDRWTLSVTSKDPITVAVKRTSGTLVPRLNLLGANQEQLNSASEDETYAAAAIQNYALPGPGQYTIVVLRADATRGGTSGAYELDVTQSAAK